ncbi:unnamed protein product, partial [Prorocentrum cordatum]
EAAAALRDGHADAIDDNGGSDSGCDIESGSGFDIGSEISSDLSGDEALKPDGDLDEDGFAALLPAARFDEMVD